MSRHFLQWPQRAFLTAVLTGLLLIAPVTGTAASPAASDDQNAPAPSGSSLAQEDQNLSVGGGLGLIRALSPETVPPRKLSAGVFVMNFDRNPGDVDFFEYSIELATGLTKRADVFVRFAPVLRTNSVNQEPIGYPPPPLDLVIDTYPTLAQRPQPYFLFTQEAPFKTYFVPGVLVHPPHTGAFAQSSGDFVVGGKVNLTPVKSPASIGVAVQGYLAIPTERVLGNSLAWRGLAGRSGKTNIGVRLLVSNVIRRARLLTNVGFERMGVPPHGLTVQYVDSSRIGTSGFLVGPPQNEPLWLHHALTLTTGTSVPAFKFMGNQVRLIGELSYTRYVGPGLAVERLVHPAEVRLGLQTDVPKVPRLSVGAAWQLLLNNAGDGQVRTSNLHTPDGKGDINFSQLVDPKLSADVSAFLAQQGITLGNNTSKVFSTNNPLFDHWRNVPVNPEKIVAQGNANILAFITWRVR
jgi:hypothetical protein